MGDSNVLGFRSRGAGEYAGRCGGGGLGGDPDGWDDWGDDGRRPEDRVGRGMGDLTQVVMLGAQVLDVVSSPVKGSDYEFAVLELEERGLYRRPGPPPPPPPPLVPAPHEQQLAWLACIVGGDDALASLDATPLAPAALDLHGVPERLHDRVVGIAERFEDAAPLLLGDEGPTAARRLLTRAVAAVPAMLRSDRDDLAAGAVLWAVAKGNDLVGHNRPVRPSVIQELCGLTSTPSGRGESFAHAVGGVGMRYGQPQWMFAAQPAVVPLGNPDLLLGAFRRRLIITRDLALQLRARTPAAG